MANEVMNFELTNDPNQVLIALNAAFDGTTQTGLKAAIAENVTTNINEKPITSIFESNGTTVKNATNASICSGNSATATVSTKTKIMTLGDVVLLEKLDEQSFNGPAAGIAAIITLKYPGNYRFIFEVKIASSIHTLSCKIISNEQILNTEISQSTNYEQKIVDIYNITAGSKLEIRLYASAAITTYIRNIRVCGVLGDYPENSIV